MKDGTYRYTTSYTMMQRFNQAVLSDTTEDMRQVCFTMGGKALELAENVSGNFAEDISPNLVPNFLKKGTFIHFSLMYECSEYNHCFVVYAPEDDGQIWLAQSYVGIYSFETRTISREEFSKDWANILQDDPEAYKTLFMCPEKEPRGPKTVYTFQVKNVYF